MTQLLLRYKEWKNKNRVEGVLAGEEDEHASEYYDSLFCSIVRHTFPTLCLSTCICAMKRDSVIFTKKIVPSEIKLVFM